jgi:hypothetical protein
MQIYIYIYVKEIEKDRDRDRESLVSRIYKVVLQLNNKKNQAWDKILQ